jgi:hypothetical protein
VTQCKSVLAAILSTIAMVGACAAQQAGPTSETDNAIESCAGCFAYLEFSASLEQESYAMRGQATEYPPSLPAAEEPNGRQTADLIAPSKQ